jgi:hypothetical protein
MLNVFLPNIKKNILYDVSFGFTFYSDKKKFFSSILSGEEVYDKIYKNENVFFKKHKRKVLIDYKKRLIFYMKKINLDYIW